MRRTERASARPYLLLAVGVVVGVAAYAAWNRTAGSGSTYVYEPLHRTASNQEAPVAPPSDLEALDRFYTELTSYASEAVVHIAVGRDQEGRRTMLQAGDGSGFVLTPDGWIVTNDHVVRASDEVQVVLADGRQLTGKVRRTNDQTLDIALIKVDAKNLPVLKFADSDSVRPGQIVIAVGSPFGLENTVTFGHVSAIGRPGQASDGFSAPRFYSGMIQTDASINPGNSGGPLINVKGEVIGVNTSIFSTSGASAGIGFSIPANVVRVVANELINTGKFDRGMLGIIPRDLKPFESRDLGGMVGAYIDRADPGSPGAKAGLKAGDVIVKIDDEEITNEIDLRVALYRRSPNDKVNVTYVRGGKQNTAETSLVAPEAIEQPQQPQQEQNPFRDMPDFPNMPDFAQPRPKLGVYLYDVDETTREQYNLPGGLEGAIVYRVSEGSVAEGAGLKPGDVLTSIGGTKIRASDDVLGAMSKLELGQETTLKFVRVTDGKATEKSVKVRLK